MSAGLELNRLARDSSYNFVRQVWALVLGMAISVMLARGLGTTDRGIYAVAMLLPSLLVTFFNLGVSPSTVYHVGRDVRTLEAAVRGNIALAFWISLLALITGVLLAFFGGEHLFPGVPLSLLLLALATLPITIHTSFLSSILQGMQDFRTYNLIVMVPGVVMLGLVVALVWWLPWSVYGAVLAYLGGNLSALILLIVVFWRRVPSARIFQLHVDRAYTRQVMSYGLRAHIANIIGFLNYRADMFLLNLITGPASVGIYSIAVALGERLWIASNSVSAVMLPRIAAMEDAESQRRELTPLITRHVLWFGVLAGGVAALLASPVIVFLYSADFGPAAGALHILLPGMILMSVAKILANDIAGRGRPELNSQQSAVAFLVNLAANLALIPRLGILGAALATTISYSFLTLFKMVVYCRLASAPWAQLVFPQPGDRQRLAAGARSLLVRMRKPTE